MWTFGTPHGTIAVPDMGRRAGEGLAGGDDRSGKDQQVHRSSLTLFSKLTKQDVQQKMFTKQACTQN